MRLAPAVSYTGTLQAAPTGFAGAHHTLRIMRAMIEKSRTDPTIIQAAHSIIFLTPERDEFAEVSALFEFVRDNIRYVADVAGIETLTAPPMVLQRRTGDCDDQTALLCSLFESVGYPTRLVMAGYSSSMYEHVYCQVFTNGVWLDCDPISRDFVLGDSSSGHVSIFVEPR
jgi:transglutaminase-like putative cysteine protease